jgi:hypothetical protein
LLAHAGMSDLHEVGDIQVNEDLSFLRKEWRFQRIGWIAMLLLVALGLSGALGRGPLSHVTDGDNNSLAVSYDRVIRHSADTKLKIVAGRALRADTLRVYITSGYMDAFEVRNIIPEPVSSGIRGPYVYYDFLRDPRARFSAITFHLTAEEYWRRRANVFTSGAVPLHVHQIILP